jgi:hypothetical protein
MNHDDPSIDVIPQVDGAEIVRAMKSGVRDALREHKRLGQSIVVWDRENQKIVEIPAEEIVVPDVDDDETKQQERA